MFKKSLAKFFAAAAERLGATKKEEEEIEEKSSMEPVTTTESPAVDGGPVAEEEEEEYSPEARIAALEAEIAGLGEPATKREKAKLLALQAELEELLEANQELVARKELDELRQQLAEAKKGNGDLRPVLRKITANPIIAGLLADLIGLRGKDTAWSQEEREWYERTYRFLADIDRSLVVNRAVHHFGEAEKLGDAAIENRLRELSALRPSEITQKDAAELGYLTLLLARRRRPKPAKPAVERKAENQPAPPVSQPSQQAAATETDEERRQRIYEGFYQPVFQNLSTGLGEKELLSLECPASLAALHPECNEWWAADINDAVMALRKQKAS
jgi:hypothetical protein